MAESPHFSPISYPASAGLIGIENHYFNISFYGVFWASDENNIINFMVGFEGGGG